MKIKIPIKITTIVKHTDNPSYKCAQAIATKEAIAEIEVEIDDAAIKVFKALWVKNELQIIVTGIKNFDDGEEIF